MVLRSEISLLNLFACLPRSLQIHAARTEEEKSTWVFMRILLDKDNQKMHLLKVGVDLSIVRSCDSLCNALQVAPRICFSVSHFAVAACAGAWL